MGTKRIFGLYVGINQNLSKLSKFISFIYLINWYCLILSSHSSSSSLLSYTLPLIGISIAERLRDRGFDCIICFDDFSKHPKSYRQISLILAKIPSRDAFPSDIPNIHASISERCGKLKLCYFNGSITASPIIETIANDITEYIATNIISITDRQLYTNKKPFLDSCRPSIDSALSVIILLLNFLSIIFICLLLLLVNNIIPITALFLIIYSSLLSILFFMNGLLLYSLFVFYFYN